MSEEQIKGLSKLQSFLDQLPVKMEKNIMRGALREGMKVVLPVAQRNVHDISGDLGRGLKIGTRSRGGTVTAYIKAEGPHGYVARWVEFGTRAHNVAAKFKGYLSFANVFAKTIHHPGSKPRPFLRPALDSQATTAVNATARYIRDRLTRKEGLDASGVKLEGDV